MTVTEFVDDLFTGYASTPELEDFKAEVEANLRDRVADLEARGSTPGEALATAMEELGDISELATEMSQQRAKDTIASMYLRHKVRPTPQWIIGYISLGSMAIIGLVLAAVAVFADWPAATLAVISIGLIALPVGALTTLGLRQETTASLPLPTKRALGYGAGVAVTLSGLFLGAAIILGYMNSWAGALAGGLPIVLIGAGILTYFGLTQTNRKKAWVRLQHAGGSQGAADEGNPFGQSPERWERFGLYFVSLWIVALAVFFILGFTLGFQFAWITFLLAIAGMLVLVAWGMKGDQTAK